MRGKHLGNDFVGALVLPDARILAKLEKVQAARKRKLVGRQLPITAEFFHRVHVAVDRQIAGVRLQHPQGDFLGDQTLEFHIVLEREQINGVVKAVADAVVPVHALWE